MFATPVMTEAGRRRALELSDAARMNLTAHADDSNQLRELGLMLGLFDVADDGATCAACPWNVDDQHDGRNAGSLLDDRPVSS